MTQRTAILHIGSGKTGTTSIQRTLAENRSALPAHGFAYAEAPGAVSHIGLAAFMQEAAAAGSGRIQLLAGSVTDLGDWLERELAALPASVHTVIFSNEHCFTRGVETGAVGALRAMLDRCFDRYRVVAYLRRQDELAVSLLSTRLKAGRADVAVFPSGEKKRIGFDYAQCLAPWQATFGEAAMTVRIFSRDTLLEGDVVRDFLHVCGLPALPQAPPEANTSLSPAAQEFLRRLNGIVAASGAASDSASGAGSVAASGARPDVAASGARPDVADRAGPAAAGGSAGIADDAELAESEPDAAAPGAAQGAGWRPPTYLRSYLTERFGGRGMLPPAAEARRFLDGFADSNEAIRARYFPERERLFADGFDRYPDTTTAPSADDILEVALAVARMQSGMIADARATRAVAAAETALAEGRRQDMVNGYLKALEFRPHHPTALRDLVRAVETDAEARTVKQYLATVRPNQERTAAATKLASRFSGEAIVSRRDAAAQARKAERKAERQTRQ